MKPTLDLRSDETPDDFPDERRRQLQSRIDAMGPWFYDIDLPGGLRTRSKVAETHGGIHETRRRMVETALLAHFGDRLSETRAVDLGCHEGYFSFALRNLGVHDVVGVDLRDDNLARARLLAEYSQQGGVRFTKGNCEDLSALSNDGYDLVLMLGLLYHQENPILCLRQAASRCNEMMVIETQVIDDTDAEVEWGRRDCIHAAEGHFALVDEGIYGDNVELGATSLALCPSPRALRTILARLGFSRIEILPAPDDAHEQFARRKRLVMTANRE
jgi:tRNA (mo5U34)-methyltransferase